MQPQLMQICGLFNFQKVPRLGKKVEAPLER